MKTSKIKKLSSLAIILSFALSGCAELNNLLQHNESNAKSNSIYSSSEKEKNLSFAQYLTDIAINESIPSSFKVRYKSGRYGVMHFIIKPNSDYSEAYIGEDNPYYKDRIVANNEAGAMFDNFKK